MIDISLNDLKKMSREDLLAYIATLHETYCFKNCKPVHPDITYRDLVESASDIIFVVDTSGNLISHNGAWFSVFQSEERLPLGRHYSNYLGGIDFKRSDEIFENVTSRGVTIENEVLEIIDTQGRVRFFSSNFSPIKNETNTITGILGNLHDITASHQAEEALMEKTALLEEKISALVLQERELQGLHDFNHDIIRNAPIGIFMIDPNGIMISENPRLKEIMGHGNETRIGVNLLRYEGFVDSGFDKLFKKCLTEKTSQTVNNVRYVPISRDRELIITMNMFPIITSENRVDKVVAMIEDNTDDFLLSQRINTVQHKAVIGAFSAGIAADIKKNTNRITMDLNFIANNIEESSPAREYIKTLKESLDRIKIITEELTALAIVPESEKQYCYMSGIFTEHPLGDIIDDIKSRGIEVGFSITPTGPHEVFAAPHQLQNLFKQIIVNAAEAMPDGGTLTIAVDTLSLDDSRYVVVEIADTGIGIPEEQMETIFKPFHTTKSKSSTGLGLMIVCYILDNLGGVLGIKSAPNEGTTMKLTFPLARRPEDSPNGSTEHDSNS